MDLKKKACTYHSATVSDTGNPLTLWSLSIQKEPKLPKTLFTSRACSEGRIIFHLSVSYLLAWSFASVAPFFVCLFVFFFFC